MKKNYLEKLEFYRILEILSTFCCTFIGKSYALNLYPSNNRKVVEDALQETRRSFKFNI